ncbi:hypothetical protein BSLG_005605 [Batrachochytrium salamandrivorans]|nr:hypothetical protein BSLG_005605 [Batrachochytrium salamandrivorans]
MGPTIEPLRFSMSDYFRNSIVEEMPLGNADIKTDTSLSLSRTAARTVEVSEAVLSRSRSSNMLGVSANQLTQLNLEWSVSSINREEQSIPSDSVSFPGTFQRNPSSSSFSQDPPGLLRADASTTSLNIEPIHAEPSTTTINIPKTPIDGDKDTLPTLMDRSMKNGEKIQDDHDHDDFMATPQDNFEDISTSASGLYPTQDAVHDQLPITALDSVSPTYSDDTVTLPDSLQHKMSLSSATNLVSVKSTSKIEQPISQSKLTAISSRPIQKQCCGAIRSEITVKHHQIFEQVVDQQNSKSGTADSLPLSVDFDMSKPLTFTDPLNFEDEYDTMYRRFQHGMLNLKANFIHNHIWTLRRQLARMDQAWILECINDVFMSDASFFTAGDRTQASISGGSIGDGALQTRNPSNGISGTENGDHRPESGDFGDFRLSQVSSYQTAGSSGRGVLRGSEDSHGLKIHLIVESCLFQPHLHEMEHLSVFILQ